MTSPAMTTAAMMKAVMMRISVVYTIQMMIGVVTQSVQEVAQVVMAMTMSCVRMFVKNHKVK